MASSIPGSEIFAYKGNTPEAIRKKAEGKVKLHSVAPNLVDSLDPLSYEVIRHRIWTATQDMGEALKRMSGSIVVTDANDFNFGIMDEVGEVVQLGPYNLGMSVALDSAVKWTIENRAENPGIEEGDMFLCNDPWVGGGLHQNDVAVFAPLFWEGELFAWVGGSAHQLDLGGVAPGSWTPRSRNVFWESLPTPPVKIVRAGRIQRDIEDVYVRRSRMPRLVALDLRAKIGANTLAIERLLSLIRKYGADMVKAVMVRMMDDAERQLRAKLRTIPDGEWNSIAYQEEAREGDRGLYKIVLKLSKKDSQLTFDFTGTDPQVEGLLNCTYSGLRGGIVWALLPIMCGDIQWASGGVMRCVDIISESGTINNAEFPAGISKASVASGWTTMNAVTECLSTMLNTKVEAESTSISVCQGTWSLAVLSGEDQHQVPFVTMMMDPMSGGLGARHDSDGIDTGGQMAIVLGRAPDVEMVELMAPLLYLWRREETDSGGPGMFRGGVGASLCLVPHDTRTRTNIVVSGSGKAVSMNVGIDGGFPGNTQQDVMVRGSDIHELFARGVMPSDTADIAGETVKLPSEIETYLDKNDVYFMLWQGGGGYLDPILREPSRVAHDIGEMRVSAASARAIYGVEIDSETGRSDVKKTQRLRKDILADRKKRGKRVDSTKYGKVELNGHSGRRWDDNLFEASVAGRIMLACAHCGQVICGKEERYVDHLARVDGKPQEAGLLIGTDPGHYIDEAVSFRQYCCPSCLTVFLAELVPTSSTTSRVKHLD